MLTDPGAGPVPDDEPRERGVTQAREHNVHTRLVAEEGTGSGLWESPAQIPVGLIQRRGCTNKRFPQMLLKCTSFCYLSQGILHSDATTCSNSEGGYEIGKHLNGSANKWIQKENYFKCVPFLIRSCAAGAEEETDGPSSSCSSALTHEATHMREGRGAIKRRAFLSESFLSKALWS